MVDSRALSLPSTALSLPSTAPTMIERSGCSSSSPAIVGAFAEALILLDADGKSKKMIDVG